MSSNNPKSINHRLQVQLAALRHDLEQAKNHGLNGEFVTNRNELFRHFVQCAREFMAFIPAYLQNRTTATDSMSEPELIRQLELAGLITHEQHRLLLTMLDDQIKVKSEPSKSLADDIEKRVREYFRLMLETSQKIAKALGISEKGEPQPDIHDLV